MALLSTLAAHDLGYITTGVAGRVASSARSRRSKASSATDISSTGTTRRRAAAAAALRVDGRQRQPGRRADRPGAGAQRARRRRRRPSPAARGRRRHGERSWWSVLATRGRRPTRDSGRRRESSSRANASPSARSDGSSSRRAGALASRWPQPPSASTPTRHDRLDDVAVLGSPSLDGRRRSAPRPADAPAHATRARRARASLWPTPCGSSFSTTTAPHLHDRLPPGRRRRPRSRWTSRSTTCWRQRRDSRVSSRSPRATCRRSTGSTSGRLVTNVDGRRR